MVQSTHQFSPSISVHQHSHCQLFFYGTDADMQPMLSSITGFKDEWGPFWSTALPKELSYLQL